MWQWCPSGCVCLTSRLGCACGTVDQQQGVLFCSRGRWTPPVVAMVQEGGVMRL